MGDCFMDLIYCVEDDEGIRDLITYAVKSAGFEAEGFESASDFEKRLGERLPSMVLLDIMLPDKDGIAILKDIRNNDTTKNVPVIMITAKGTESDKVKGFEYGADDYVTKPFNMTILVLRIRKLIELSRYHRVTQGMIDPAPSEIVITSLDEKLIEKAIKYVEDNMSRTELSVEELSRELGMSRVHLYKKLLQITGKTPIEFIRVIRLKRAAQLLRESQLHVSEVAFEVGFNNPKYFSRYFKDEFGVLPSVYQEKEGK